MPWVALYVDDISMHEINGSWETTTGSNPSMCTDNFSLKGNDSQNWPNVLPDGPVCSWSGPEQNQPSPNPNTPFLLSCVPLPRSVRSGDKRGGAPPLRRPEPWRRSLLSRLRACSAMRGAPPSLQNRVARTAEATPARGYRPLGATAQFRAILPGRVPCQALHRRNAARRREAALLPRILYEAAPTQQAGSKATPAGETAVVFLFPILHHAAQSVKKYDFADYNWLLGAHVCRFIHAVFLFTWFVLVNSLHHQHIMLVLLTQCLESGSMNCVRVSLMMIN
jgi:hypothetical protein